MVQAFLDRQEESFDIFYRAAKAKSNNITDKQCLPIKIRATNMI